MAKKTVSAEDERKARARYIDQPGQWTDVTPKSVKKRQDKAWTELLNGHAKQTKDQKKKVK